MGRGRGKGKKQTIIAACEDPGSGEEEKIPKKRGRRPQKTLKDEIEEEEEEAAEEIEDEEVGENTKSSVSNKYIKSQAAMENGRKRKRPSQVKENPELVKEENGVGTKGIANGSIKSVGFRQNRSRRKNKPQRAAEVGVKCK